MEKLYVKKNFMGVNVIEQVKGNRLVKEIEELEYEIEKLNKEIFELKKGD